MKATITCAMGAFLLSVAAYDFAGDLGLPPVPVPADNPQTPAKIALGKKLFDDKRLSSDGTVSCSTCHDEQKAFTDSPLVTSKGVAGKLGTRNAPTVLNSAFMPIMFWDGREPTLEEQSKDPMVNPVEMGLKDHQPVLDLVKSDADYQKQFRQAFGIAPSQITMHEVQQAIASFERTVVSGNSPFDHWFFNHEENAISPAAKRGYVVFTEQGRCVSCHTTDQTSAIFTDGRFHNIGIGVNQIQQDVPQIVGQFLAAKNQGVDVDKAVLGDKKSSELGRFAIDDRLQDIGAFKTPTLRNIAATAPYMHDGSLKTLRDVIEHYNNGGRTHKTDRVNDYLDGGIRPLNLSDQQISDLIAFLETLTSPEYQPVADRYSTQQSTLTVASQELPKTDKPILAKEH